jgi:hypothetical protein
MVTGTSAVDHRRHGLGGLAVVVRQEMPVTVEREADRGVSETAADRLDVPACRDEVSAM